jgi:hypothetical protein
LHKPVSPFCRLVPSGWINPQLRHVDIFSSARPVRYIICMKSPMLPPHWQQFFAFECLFNHPGPGRWARCCTTIAVPTLTRITDIQLLLSRSSISKNK